MPLEDGICVVCEEGKPGADLDVCDECGEMMCQDCGEKVDGALVCLYCAEFLEESNFLNGV
jgi:formylmethanofuran dehydrogenase subunit E